MGTVSGPDRTTHSSYVLGYSCKTCMEHESRGTIQTCIAQGGKLSPSSYRVHVVEAQKLSS